MFHAAVLLTFLKVVPKFAELANTIQIIIYDARWFLAMLVYALLVFSQVFWLFGRQQLYSDVTLKKPDILEEERIKKNTTSLS